MIKAIFLDFDGTLYSHKTNKIPNSAYDAILQAQKNGILIFLATGRSLGELNTFDCRNIKFDGYVLNNGQQLLDNNCEQLWINFISGNNKKAMIDVFNEKKIPLVLTTDNYLFINYINQTVIDTFNIIDSEVPQIKEYEGEDFLMASMFVSNQQDRDFLQSFSNDFEITWWQDNSADLLIKGGNKIGGITKMLEHYSLTTDEIMTVGDGNNDIEMLKKAGVGVAMGNSVPEIKEIADFITNDIDNDGLFNAFKHYNII